MDYGVEVMFVSRIYRTYECNQHEPSHNDTIILPYISSPGGAEQRLILGRDFMLYHVPSGRIHGTRRLPTRVLELDEYCLDIDSSGGLGMISLLVPDHCPAYRFLFYLLLITCFILSVSLTLQWSHYHTKVYAIQRPQSPTGVSTSPGFTYSELSRSESDVY